MVTPPLHSLLASSAEYRRPLPPVLLLVALYVPVVMKKHTFDKLGSACSPSLRRVCVIIVVPPFRVNERHFASQALNFAHMFLKTIWPIGHSRFSARVPSGLVRGVFKQMEIIATVLVYNIFVLSFFSFWSLRLFRCFQRGKSDEQRCRNIVEGCIINLSRIVLGAP